MKTQLSDTSKRANDKVSPHKQTHKQKLIFAMERIEQGTSYQLAINARMTHAQAWKRCGELVKDGIFIDTKLRGVSPDGNPAIIYALKERESDFTNIPKPEYISKNETTAADYANLIIQAAQNQKKQVQAILQPELF